MGLLDHWQQKPDPPLRPFYICGLDLGKSMDFTAWALLETHAEIGGPGIDAVYHCRHLQRFKLGTSYPHM